MLRKIIILAVAVVAALSLALFLSAPAATAKPRKSPPPPPPPPSECVETEVSGTASALHHNRGGDLDGFTVDGTDVKFPPHEGDWVDAILDSGDAVTVTGCLHTGPAGDTHLRASTIGTSDGTVTISEPAPPAPRPRR